MSDRAHTVYLLLTDSSNESSQHWARKYNVIALVHVNVKKKKNGKNALT